MQEISEICFHKHYIDLALDAKNIGRMFPNLLSNIVMINLFHHVDDSKHFLNAAESLLASGSRVIMIEPFISTMATSVLILSKMVNHIFLLIWL